MNPRSILIALVWFSVVVCVPLAPADAKTPRAKTPATQSVVAPVTRAKSPGPVEWNIFRTMNPYHIQGVAMAAPRADGSRLLVIAEPPPAITFAAIQAVGPAALAGAEIVTYPIGHDGWVRDVVALLPRLPDGEINALCNDINALLFGTSYKAIVYDIPASVPSKGSIVLGQAGLDLHVSVEDLKHWLLEQKMDFVPALGGAPVKIADLLEEGASGVFFSQQEGLVAWLLPEGVDVATRQFDARVFALDSDIVLGALSGERGAAIIARERSTPLTALPPLRAETIFQLAAATTAELAQSYERNNAFAGRFDESHDWAPIYLSEQLIDTEYGSLLNITDQLLKSWSNAGMTRYEQFLYPDPGRFPFPKALPMHLGVDEVTYNWNTKGAGYAFEAGRYAVLALNRTGALPVSYIPGDGAGAAAVMKAEDVAYEYFSGLGDPHLARVVQYAMLYQAFLNLKIGTAGSLSDTNEARVNPLLLEEMRRAFERLMTADSAQILTLLKPWTEELIKELRPKVEEEIRQFEAKKNVKLNAEQRAKARDIVSAEHRKDVTKYLSERVAAARDALRSQIEAAGDQDLALEQFLMHPTGEKQRLAASVLCKMTDLVALRERLVAAGESHATGWIHTPTVVVSWNQGVSGEFVGGHNLDARISVFREDPAQPRGKIRLDTGERHQRVVFNPADGDRVAQIVRDVGRREQDLSKLWPEVAKHFAAVSERPIRALPKALSLPTRPASTIRGLRPTDIPAGRGAVQGWISRTASPVEAAQAAALQNAAGRPLVKFRSSAEGYEMVMGEGGAQPLASGKTLESVVDALHQLVPDAITEGRSEVVFYLENFSEVDTRNICRSLDARGSGDKMARIRKEKPLSTKELRELTAAQFDASQIKFSAIERRTIPGGEELSVRLEIPQLEPTKPSLIARLTMRVKGLLSEAVVAKFQSAIRNIGARLRGDTNLLDLQRSLRQLQKDVPDVPFDLELSFPGEAGDITFVQATRLPPAIRYGPRHCFAG